MSRDEILVFDDSSRFPLHVWRYLSGFLGFGIGEVGTDGRRIGQTIPSEPWIPPGSPLVAEDGRYRLWWIPADAAWRQNLDVILPQLTPGSRVYSLVDIRGKGDYSYGDVCGRLYERLPAERLPENAIRLVSSYYSGHRVGANRQLLRVLPKTRETLRQVAHDLGITLSDTFRSDKVKHILVTGAGFEIHGDRGGFGMPPTSQVLEEAFGSQDMTLVKAKPLENGKTVPDDAFPVLSSEHPDGIWEPHKPLVKHLNAFAVQRDLDHYWDLLLEEELDERLARTREDSSADGRDESKTRALWRERRLREAFRRSLLQHDWGFMNQSVDAARMPWHAWLTTNYTQFANRAIALYGHQAEETLGAWRSISIAAEAKTLIREGTKLQEQRERYLFKLHGDIAHLQTMAIAGHDKEIFSPLSMPMEDLYQVYAAAEQFLPDSLRPGKSDPQPELIVWHIVGHGLQDRRLCRLLGRAALEIKPPQLFVVVNRRPMEPSKHLQASLKTFAVKRRAIMRCRLDAAHYMARLLDFFRSEEKVLGGAMAFKGWLAEQCQ